MDDLRAVAGPRWPSRTARARSGAARAGHEPRDVVIGVSPARRPGRLAVPVRACPWRTCSGRCWPAWRRKAASAGWCGSTTPSTSVGSAWPPRGCPGRASAIGLQGKGTALIHRRDLAPLANLELYSVAPSVTLELYRLLGANAARHAKGATPDPARNPYSDEAIEARYHTTVIALMELERARVVPGAAPVELSLEGLL